MLKAYAAPAPVPGTGGRVLALAGDPEEVPRRDSRAAVPLFPELRFSSALRSPLQGVLPQSWRRLVAALEVQPMGEVSRRGGLGSYDLRPRRLAELGYVTDLRRKGRPGRRGEPQVYVCRFVPPLTRERFLSDALVQLKALCLSMKLYHADLTEGRLALPQGLSLAGTLAILHSGGRGALHDFAQRGTKALFPHSRTVFERAKGAF